MAKKISNKQRINLSIDMDLYIKLKYQNINISNLFNNFLSNYLQSMLINPDIQQLEKQLEKAQQESNKINTKIIKLTSEITAAKINQQKEQQKEIKDLVATADALQAADWLNTEEEENADIL